MSEARAPAECYYEIAAFLGEDWFLRPPALVGQMVSVAGRDAVETRWHLDRSTATKLIQHVHNCPDMAFMGSLPFDQRRAAR